MPDYPLTAERIGAPGVVLAARFIGGATGGGRFVFLPRRVTELPPEAWTSFASAIRFYADAVHGGGATACKAIEACTGEPYHGGEVWVARAVTPDEWRDEVLGGDSVAGSGTDPCLAIEDLRKRNEERRGQ